MVRLVVSVLAFVLISWTEGKVHTNTSPGGDSLATITDGDKKVADVCGDKTQDGRPVDAFAIRSITSQDFLDMKAGEFEHRDDKMGYVMRFSINNSTIDAKIYLTKRMRVFKMQYDLAKKEWSKISVSDFDVLPSNPCQPKNLRQTRGFKEFCVKTMKTIGFSCKFVNKRTKTILYKVVCAALSFGAGLFTPIPGDGLALTAACHTAIDSAIRTCRVAGPGSNIVEQVCNKIQ